MCERPACQNHGLSLAEEDNSGNLTADLVTRGYGALREEGMKHAQPGFLRLDGWGIGGHICRPQGDTCVRL